MPNATLDKRTQHRLGRAVAVVSERLYEVAGATAVYELAEQLGWEMWGHCHGCAAEVPAYAGACLCCGDSVRGGGHA